MLSKWKPGLEWLKSFVSLKSSSEEGGSRFGLVTQPCLWWPRLFPLWALRGPPTVITRWLLWHQAPCAPEQEEMAWEQKESSLLVPLSYPGGELPKQTIPLYLIDWNEALCPPFRPLTGKGKAFPWKAWTIPVGGHLAVGMRKRELAVGRQPTVAAILTLSSLWISLSFPLHLCQGAFPDFISFVQHTLFYHELNFAQFKWQSTLPSSLTFSCPNLVFPASQWALGE